MIAWTSGFFSSVFLTSSTFLISSGSYERGRATEDEALKFRVSSKVNSWAFLDISDWLKLEPFGVTTTLTLASFWGPTDSSSAG